MNMNMFLPTATLDNELYRLGCVEKNKGFLIL